MLSWWRSWLLLGVHLRGSWGLELGGSVVPYLRYNRNGRSGASWTRFGALVVAGRGLKMGSDSYSYSYSSY